MGTSLSVANERESSPDPWWPNSSTASTSSVNNTSVADDRHYAISTEEPKHNDELAIAVTTAVVNAPYVPEDICSIDDISLHDENDSQPSENENLDENDSRHEENQKKLEIFKKELAAKREARQKAIAALTDKLKQLQEQVKIEQQLRKTAENEVTRLKNSTTENYFKSDLEIEKQKVKELQAELENERKSKLELEKRTEEVQERDKEIKALKEVALIGKEMLRIRELQVNELKKKLCETQYPEDLREEYEVQIQNVRRLKTLYEERAEAVRIEHEREIEREVGRIKLLETKTAELERERKEAEVMREHLKDRVLKLDQELEEKNDTAMILQEQLDTSVIECRDLASQMNLINNLFSQMLVGNLNLERITRLVEENQSLVIDLTSDDKKNDLAALLIDIAKQLEEENVTDDTSDTNVINNNEDSISSNNNNNGTMTQQDVAVNLSKVWRILVQLLTQDQTTSTPVTPECDSESCCYKSIETPSGKRSVISVSQTFITLKNLILEKNTLIKEVNKLRLLNGHLESRLNNQERRLSTVSTELKKTWGVVSKLRLQHKQLHTQEKILKYELQHKRLMLNDLKDELERCKEIWDMARQKNFQSEEEWRKLRKEFADRRKNTDVNNSAESGYEDDESNTPPTEESIDEQELDRLLDKESDALLSMNEELPTSESRINSIQSSEETNTDDSDNTLELIETINVSCDEEIQRKPCGSLDITESNLTRKITNKEKHQIPDSLSRLPQSDISITEKTLDCDELRKSNPSKICDTSAENVSKFLEGLLAGDEKPLEQNQRSLTITEPCSSHDSLTNSENSYISKAEDILLGCTDNSSQFDVEIIKTDDAILKSEVTETVFTTSTSVLGDALKDEQPVDITSLNDEDEEGKFDEACGFAPNYSSGTSTYQDLGLPSIQEVLGSLTAEDSQVSVLSNDKLDKTSQISTDNKAIDNRTTEQVLDARTERLKRLEEQCKSLFNKVTATTIKSNVLSSKLELLHEQYGRSNETFDDATTTSTINREKDENKSDKNINS